MTSIIGKIQKEATENITPVSSLLRKIKILAIKLDNKDFFDWVDRELNGYSDKDKIPEYRIVKGIPQGYNPYRDGYHI